MAEKIRCGSGKTGATTNQGQFCNITVNPEVINQHIEEYQGHKYVKLSLFIANKLNDYGKNIEVTINTWKPEAKPETNSAAEEEDLQNLPF